MRKFYPENLDFQKVSSNVPIQCSPLLNKRQNKAMRDVIDLSEGIGQVRKLSA